MLIDNTFDFRKDVKPEADPDKDSKKLLSYHKYLWSKDLPNGQKFELSDNEPNKYLFHKSSLGEFSLSSDGIGVSFINRKDMKEITDQISEKRKGEILEILYSIGGFIIFPSNKIIIDGKKKLTINGERGWNKRIVDRFDLTLECIRRYYLDIESPLKETLERYKSFFLLFEDFRHYVEFFFLQDLVNTNFTEIKFFLDFDDKFPQRPLPKNLKEYNQYINNNVDFVIKRRNRMK